MLTRIRLYILFLWRSTNEHGVHSPFVFGLVTKCFYDQQLYTEYGSLRDYRRALLQNTDSIQVSDFGAGSKVFRSDKRRVAQIAKTAGISGKRAELLFRMVRWFKPGSILEIGTSLGLATAALSLGNRHAKVTSVEGCSVTAGIAQRQLSAFGCNNARVEVSEFNVYLNRAAIQQQAGYDFIYFDGNHQKQSTIDYFEMLLPLAKNDSVWIFDDIHWSAEMVQAWQYIKNHPKVTVTIDTFQWGVVFFRAEQQKEHFTIRI